MLALTHPTSYARLWALETHSEHAGSLTGLGLAGDSVWTKRDTENRPDSRPHLLPEALPRSRVPHPPSWSGWESDVILTPLGLFLYIQDVQKAFSSTFRLEPGASRSLSSPPSSSHPQLQPRLWGQPEGARVRAGPCPAGNPFPGFISFGEQPSRSHKILAQLRCSPSRVSCCPVAGTFRPSAASGSLFGAPRSAGALSLSPRLRCLVSLVHSPSLLFQCDCACWVVSSSPTHLASGQGYGAGPGTQLNVSVPCCSLRA